MTLSGFTYVVMNQTELDYLDIGDLDENIILLDGMESAIIGLVQSFEGLRVLYDTNKILTLLQNDGI